MIFSDNLETRDALGRIPFFLNAPYLHSSLLLPPGSLRSSEETKISREQLAANGAERKLSMGGRATRPEGHKAASTVSLRASSRIKIS